MDNVIIQIHWQSVITDSLFFFYFFFVWAGGFTRFKFLRTYIFSFVQIFYEKLFEKEKRSNETSLTIIQNEQSLSSLVLPVVFDVVP